MSAKGPGQPPKDDAAAVKDIRRIRAAHPKWSIDKAAMHYAQAHEEKDATPRSAASRLAGKVRRQMGQPRKPRAVRHQLLQELRQALAAALSAVEKLTALELKK